MSQGALFLLSCAAGIGLYTVYFLEKLLAKSTRLLPVTVILDFIWCAVCAAALNAIMMFLGGGRFLFFVPCAAGAGFFAAAIAVTALVKKKASAFSH